MRFEQAFLVAFATRKACFLNQSSNAQNLTDMRKTFAI